ncbi:MAG TPA: nuclear transport factor 2 family protein [Steroidobacteraceae bacterium]|nr:nuclear transport factor 2 family protein [Steroidobacteraceae bacterium]
MAERVVAERLIRDLHAARVGGDLAGMCKLFADQGRYEIVGASADKPIAIRANGLAEFKPWLSMMVKVFRLSDYHLLSLVVEWPRATAHWRTDIYSKVTGVTVPTELVDLFELSNDRILSYTEFFAPR